MTSHEQKMNKKVQHYIIKTQTLPILAILELGTFRKSNSSLALSSLFHVIDTLQMNHTISAIQASQVRTSCKSCRGALDMPAASSGAIRRIYTDCRGQPGETDSNRNNV